MRLWSILKEVILREGYDFQFEMQKGTWEASLLHTDYVGSKPIMGLNQ